MTEESSEAVINKPKVSVKVMILKDDRILLGRRKKAFAQGQYEFPGGHFEYMESFEECAVRETREECGIEIEEVCFQCVANVRKYPPRHYVHIGLIANWKRGNPRLIEPDNHESWHWYELDNLPAHVFEPCGIIIDSYFTGKIYYVL